VWCLSNEVAGCDTLLCARVVQLNVGLGVGRGGGRGLGLLPDEWLPWKDASCKSFSSV
jgi:hypothetical protein